ncbi:hypothetical protein BOTCAL_0056g00290 [Botryotinia calthae]|uniref:Uncharacterized protein n=1 Tax=Botryotinia calthae TaxID=38488 RepID=A0A4Y8DAH9_9HELO|nr:hypothetical protein BOTCAL_0056g00290 [Botryotinia calthae]
MSDAELDSQYVPTGRPQSQMARSFALALDDLFKLDSSEDLDAIVSEKKNEISTKTSELEELEARLRATEERLKAKQAAAIPGSLLPGNSASRQKQSTDGPISPLEPKFENNITSRVVGIRGESLASRPAAPKPEQSYTTALASHIPGALPPTPGASEGEYELDGDRTSADYVIVTKDGDVPPTGTE